MASQAPCWGQSELFFSTRPDDHAAAKAVCAGCPLWESCFRGAAERHEPWGVWGGVEFEKEFRRLMRRAGTVQQAVASVAQDREALQKAS